MIYIITVAVIAVFIAGWFIRQAMDKRKLEREAIRRSVEDAERRKRVAEPWPPLQSFDDTTVELPHFEGQA